MPGDDPAEQIFDGHILLVHRLARSLETRQVEQVADDMLHAVALVADDRKIARARVGVEHHAAHRQRLQVPAHRGERRHQLVRDIGQQHAPLLIRRLQLLGPRGQVLRHLIEGVRHRGHFIAALFAGARGEVAAAHFSCGYLQAAQTASHRAEDQQRRRRGASRHQHESDNQ